MDMVDIDVRVQALNGARQTPTKGKRWCSAPNCNNFRGKMRNLSFFKFPKNIERCKIWIKNSAREDLFNRDITTLYDSGVCLCAEHFDNSMFVNVILKNKLVTTAVPTVFEHSDLREMLYMPVQLDVREPSRKSRSKHSPVVSDGLRTVSVHSNSHEALNSSGSMPTSWCEMEDEQGFASSSRDPSHGPAEASFDEGPFRPKGKNLSEGCFPKRKFGQSFRSFQESWYNQYPWLEYSILKDAAYCFYCRLFALQLPFRPERPFVYEGYRYWKNASLDLRLHGDSKVHIQSKIAYEKRLGITSTDDVSGLAAAATSLQPSSDQDLQQYRKGVAKIIDVTLFLGRRGLLCSNSERGDSEDPGHFLDFLKWSAKDDPDLVSCISHPYLYRGVLNRDDLTQLCVENVRKAITTDVEQQADGYFSLLCDELESEDTHNCVISVCLRYVSRYLQVYERFIGFWKVDRFEEEAGAPNVCDFFQMVSYEVGLIAPRLRGIAFGVLSRRSASWRRAESQLQSASPGSLRTWCHFRSFHRLVFELCQQHIREVRVVFSTVNRFYAFVTSFPKCRAVYRKHNVFHNADFWDGGDAGHDWAASPTNLCHLRDNIRSIIQSLQEFAERGGQEGAEADSLIEAFNRFEFICYLHTYTNVLSVVNASSEYIADPNFTVEGMVSLVKAAAEVLRQMRTDKYFDALLDDVKQETDKLGIEPAANSHSPKRVKYESVDYLYRDKFFQMCELVESELCTEFGLATPAVGRGAGAGTAYELLIIAERLITNRVSSVADRQSDFDKVVAQFGADLEQERLMDDLKQFYDVVECDSESAKMDLRSVYDIVSYFMSNNFTDEFPELNKLLRLYLMMPLTPPHPDKSFSVLRRLQAHLEAAAPDGRLHHSVLLAIESEESLKFGQSETLEVLADRYIETILQSHYISQQSTSIKSEVMVID